jgi:hypothetical protein
MRRIPKPMQQRMTRPPVKAASRVPANRARVTTRLRRTKACNAPEFLVPAITRLRRTKGCSAQARPARFRAPAHLVPVARVKELDRPHSASARRVLVQADSSAPVALVARRAPEVASVPVERQGLLPETTSVRIVRRQAALVVVVAVPAVVPQVPSVAAVARARLASRSVRSAPSSS